jgi:hypothetical protein
MENLPNSRKYSFLFLLFVFVTTGCGGNYRQDLKQADQSYEAGDRDAAKKFFRRGT